MLIFFMHRRIDSVDYVRIASLEKSDELAGHLRAMRQKEEDKGIAPAKLLGTLKHCGSTTMEEIDREFDTLRAQGKWFVKGPKQGRSKKLCDLVELAEWNPDAHYTEVREIFGVKIDVAAAARARNKTKKWKNRKADYHYKDEDLSEKPEGWLPPKLTYTQRREKGGKGDWYSIIPVVQNGQEWVPCNVCREPMWPGELIKLRNNKKEPMQESQYKKGLPADIQGSRAAHAECVASDRAFADEEMCCCRCGQPILEGNHIERDPDKYEWRHKICH
jgi:hypothetical protein